MGIRWRVLLLLLGLVYQTGSRPPDVLGRALCSEARKPGHDACREGGGTRRRSILLGSPRGAGGEEVVEVVEEEGGGSLLRLRGGQQMQDEGEAKFVDLVPRKLPPPDEDDFQRAYGSPEGDEAIFKAQKVCRALCSRDVAHTQAHMQCNRPWSFH